MTNMWAGFTDNDSEKQNNCEKQIHLWIQELRCKEIRANAMCALSQLRGSIENIGFLLWHSFGCVSSLVQEIVDVLPAVRDESLTPNQSHRACYAISLLQTIAAHPETKVQLLRSRMLMYLVPLLKSTSQTNTIEYLRMSCLGVVVVVLKQANDDSLQFVLTSDIMPIALRLIETGTEMCKAASAYIVYHIIEHDMGLTYVCSQPDRFTHVIFVLGKVVMQLELEPSIRILKQVVRCYERLADNPRARNVLSLHLPDQLRDSTFSECIQEDQGTRIALIELIRKIGFG